VVIQRFVLAWRTRKWGRSGGWRNLADFAKKPLVLGLPNGPLINKNKCYYKSSSEVEKELEV
jgi:hypothetical protein